MEDILFKYTNGVNVISNQWMKDGEGIRMGNNLYLSHNDYHALMKVLDMQKTRWGRFQLWFNRVVKKHF